MYQCMAKNDLDTRYSSGQLKVLVIPPSFVKTPLDEKIFDEKEIIDSNIDLLTNVPKHLISLL